MRRKGVSRRGVEICADGRLIAAMLVRAAMRCNCVRTLGNYAIIAIRPNVIGLLNGVIRWRPADADPAWPQLFICDTHVNRDTSADEIAEMTIASRRGGPSFG